MELGIMIYFVIGVLIAVKKLFKSDANGLSFAQWRECILWGLIPLALVVKWLDWLLKKLLGYK